MFSSLLRDEQQLKIPDLCMLEVGNLAAGEAVVAGEHVPIDKIVNAIQESGDPRQTPRSNTVLL
jgi:hypothetical protein